ncbi:hypothetical protein SMSP1_00590 [Sedimentisphaera salicampi]|nr:hypothetical protein SMSP1_00590 [Sedimentisphaera salicampi]
MIPASKRIFAANIPKPLPAINPEKRTVEYGKSWNSAICQYSMKNGAAAAVRSPKSVAKMQSDIGIRYISRSIAEAAIRQQNSTA